MNMEDSIPALADAIFRDKVMRARNTPPSRKIGLGAEIYTEVLGRMRSGVRMQFPEADECEVERILGDRLNRLSRLEEHALFHPAPLSHA